MQQPNFAKAAIEIEQAVRCFNAAIPYISSEKRLVSVIEALTTLTEDLSAELEALVG